MTVSPRSNAAGHEAPSVGTCSTSPSGQTKLKKYPSDLRKDNTSQGLKPYAACQGAKSSITISGLSPSVKDFAPPFKTISSAPSTSILRNDGRSGAQNESVSSRVSNLHWRAVTADDCAADQDSAEASEARVCSSPGIETARKPEESDSPKGNVTITAFS